MTSSIIQVISWLFLSALTIVLLFTPTIWGHSDELLRSGILAIGALILATLATLFFVSKKKHTFSYSPISLSIFLIMVVVLFSTLFSVSIEQSIFGFGMEVGTAASFLSLLVMYLASRMFFPNTKLIQIFYLILSISFLILAPIVFVTAFFDTQSIIFDTFDFAVFSGLVLLLSIASSEFKKHTIYNTVVIGISSAGVLLGNDRAIQISIFVSLLLVVLTKLYVKIKSEGTISTPYVSGFFLILLIVAFIFPALPIIKTTQPVEIRPSFQVTRTLAQDSILDNPANSLLGSGPATFLYDWNKYKPLAINETPLWNTNFRNGVGGIPTLFITLGILCGFAFLFLFISIGYAGISGVVKSVQQKERLFFVVSAFAASSYGLILFLLQIVSVADLALLFVFIGILSAVTESKKAISVHILLRSLFAILVVPVILVSAFFAVTKIYYVFSFENDLVTFNRTGEVAEAIAGTQCATKYIDHAVCYRFLAELQRKHLQDLFAENQTQPEDTSTALTASMLINGEKAATTNKNDYRNWIVLGNVYTQLSLMGADDTFKKGIESYDKAIELAPRDPFVLLRKAQLLYYIGKDEAGARAAVNQSLELKSNYEPAKSFLDVLNQVN